MAPRAETAETARRAECTEQCWCLAATAPPFRPPIPHSVRRGHLPPRFAGGRRMQWAIGYSKRPRCELELDGGGALVFLGGGEGRHRLGGIERGPEPAGIGLDIGVVSLHRLDVIA